MTTIDKKIANLCKLLKNKYEGNNKKEIKRLLSEVLTPYELSYFYYYALFSINHNKGDVEISKKLKMSIEEVYLTPFKGTMTLTFGEVAESHVGMQQLGKKAEKGFQLHELKRAQRYFDKRGCKTTLVKLNDFLPNSFVPDTEKERKALHNAKTEDSFQAYVLIARDGMKCLTGDTNGKELTTQMLFYEWDSQMFDAKKEKVTNKNARHNLNFDDKSQKSNFEIGHGTTISWDEVPILKSLKAKLVIAFGNAAKELKCEGNKYYNLKKCGIGRHGDTERKKVIGVRLGSSMTMMWNWSFMYRPRGLNISFVLNPGDVYCMSEKSVGTDWKSGSKYTIRHAAGGAKYTTCAPGRSQKLLEVKNQRSSSEYDGLTLGDIWFRPGKSQKDPNPVLKKMP